MSNLLIVPAAGIGRRLGRSEPKALAPLEGRPMIEWTLDALLGLPFARAVVAVPGGREADFEAVVSGRAGVIAGGETRASSVRLAFHSLDPSDADLVCIHDAARPLASAAEARSVLEAAARTGAAIAAMPIADTVKRVRSDYVVETVDRSSLFAAGTPQVFRADLLRRALAAGDEATDEASLLERLGIPVAVVEVSRLGFKITTSEDLEMAEALLRSRKTGIGEREKGRT
ncbi:MAG: 2-C-methyl-D-erythritol 4-phosphate cytidylyltransferase [Acidobacteriota bacterium]|nr:2-C-methyl-D-erythritol 4-phosphate cytidylyltransferase [Acidobacteriota bacterium]MDQ5872009.1 2-C-methyl-D-erythritol 4-phosphate cytidylyltransferase [Acidobacteriota bacterium]